MITIKPNIIINQPVKNKTFGYFTIFDPKNPNHLLIKAKSFSGQSRGVVGKILKDGTVVIDKVDTKIHLLLTSKVRKKLEFILDMIYGLKRDKQVMLNKKGQIIIHK